ncbi:MAG: SGNH/GDSL hydrolase family protein [Sphaerochaeta sp.]|nr:SGNH/GDSL hydrolase family protein [Sphaerochaeta sp.]
MIQRIRIFGDSILKGVIYDKSSNQYSILKNPPINGLSQTYGLDIHNSSMFGSTISKGIKLLQRAIDRGLSCEIVLVEFGGNDCDFPWADIAQNPTGEFSPNTPLAVFSSTLQKMVETLKAKKILPVLMTLPPIVSMRYLNHICRDGLNKEAILTYLQGDAQKIARFQELYSLKIKSIAKETKTALIDVRSAFLQRHDFGSLICEDGIHPNHEGHLLIASSLGEYLGQRSS